jgi:quercetin dioxygenase-like cupin family protein
MNQLKDSSPILLPVARHEDERGVIHHLTDNIPTTSLSVISCVKGAVRANHRHLNDYHICVLTKGSMNYYERPAGSKEKPVKTFISTGEPFFTKTMVEHAMEFLEDSEFVCLSKLSRTSENYEKDTVRVPSLIDAYNNE